MIRASRPHQSRAKRMRQGLVARLVIAGLLLFLVVPLYRLQIRSTEAFVLQARNNRVRPMVVRAPRGTIYDRHGRVVAENVVGYQILLMPDSVGALRRKVERLQPILGMLDVDVERAFRRYQRAPHLPMEVMADAPPDAVARLQERRFAFPDVLVQEYPKRHYPAGEAVAHLIGYISEIDSADLASETFAGYQQGRWIGKQGLERQYEKHLGGEPGVRYLEINASGHIRDWLPDSVGRAPVPGKDLHLYLDLDLQEFIAHIWPEDSTGAVVGIEPETGGILAYYSHPTFDPNRFIGGVSPSYYASLRDDPAKPMLDRVVGSGQPAASTWKLAVAGMALDLNAISPDEYMPIPCTGGASFLGDYRRCWYGPGHGRQNLIEAIKNSCNIYFYQVALRIGLDRFLETGTRMGFAEKTGVDVPAEIAPIFPESRDYWRRNFRYDPQPTEVLSMAIGQGPITMTAIKLAHIYAALGAPEGKVPAPRLARGMDAERDTFQFRLDPVEVWYLEAGMRRVVSPGGTAQLSRLQDWDFVGKTGTAQNPHGPSHGWFVGQGGPPGGDPEIAMTAFMEFAEHGYIPSGYVAEAINFYLDRKHGKPFRGWGTIRLRNAHGWRQWPWQGPIIDPPFPGSGGTPTVPPPPPPPPPDSTGG